MIYVVTDPKRIKLDAKMLQILTIRKDMNQFQYFSCLYVDKRKTSVQFLFPLQIFFFFSKSLYILQSIIIHLFHSLNSSRLNCQCNAILLQNISVGLGAYVAFQPLHRSHVNENSPGRNVYTSSTSCNIGASFSVYCLSSSFRSFIESILTVFRIT